MSQSRAPIFRGLALGARGYIGGVAGFAFAAVVAGTLLQPGPELDPGLLIVAGLLCALANLFEVFAPANFSFQPNLIIFFAASVLLPPWAIAAVAVVSFLPGWLTHHFRWYMVAFNIANYTLAGMTAHAITAAAGHLDGSTFGLPIPAALIIAAVAFVLVNHALIIGVVSVTRGRPVAQCARDMYGVFPMDMALTTTGACVAILWSVTPSLSLLAAGPIALIYRALWVPLLEHKSRTDPKTGLFNSAYLSVELDDALNAAERSGGGLSVVMIDLDQLRLVNNRHGHLAGDEVIQAVADAVRTTAERHDGIAARFGGDELCVLLPKSPLERSREIAEEIRAAVAGIAIDFDGATEPLAMTVSAGIASYPEHADTAEGLLGAADAAVYDAKLGGRNRTRIALAAGVRDALARPEAGAEAALTMPAEQAMLPIPTHSVPAPVAAATAAVPPEPVPADGPESAGQDAEPQVEDKASAKRNPAIDVYIGILVAATAVIGALTGHGAILGDPWLFVALVASVVALDAARIDVFERANLSPAAIPELALAYFFGPLGPIAAEAVIAAVRAIRREPIVKWAFDFGALSLSGAAAAWVFDLMPTAADGGSIAVGAIAGVAYYAVNSALLAIVMGLAEGRSPVGVWRERLAWMTPHYVAFGMLAGTFVIAELSFGLYALAVFGMPVLMLWIAEKQYLDRSRATVSELRTANDELERANASLRGLLNDNQQLLGRMHHSYISTITSLARTVEAKDPNTSGHTERVADIAVVLADQLGYDDAQLAAIRVGAVIHDIGKIAIPDSILLKPGPLDPQEFAIMRRHPEMSSYIVAELELPSVVKQMVRSHHERFDGAGYPDRLLGEEIPLAARILTVADSLDAMISDRPYRKALPLEVAKAEIEDKAGTQFCPRVVAALNEAIASKPGFWAGLGDESPAEDEPPSVFEALQNGHSVPDASPQAVQS
jgi:diguanylate cyclase (GGDEF)-like protein/putative nucleotidyltransferase with HDIG domain